MALTNTSVLDNLLATYFERKALKRLVAKAQLYQFATKTPVPKAGGKAVVWNAYTNFAAVTGSLTEGTNPTAAAMSSRKVTATLAQYGRVVQNTDLLEATNSLDTVTETVENLSDSAGLSLDKIIQVALFKGTISKNADGTILSSWMSARVSAFASGDNGGVSTGTWGFPVVMGTTATRLSAVNKAAPSVSARLSLYSIKKAVKQLRAKNAMPFADGYFKLVTNSDAIADLRTDPDFKGWLQYVDSKPMQMGEATTPVEGARVYESNNMPKYRATAHSCDVSFIFGQGAYGVANLAGGDGGGKGFEIIIKRPGPNDTSNALNLFATIGYKITTAAAALNTSAGRTLFTHSKP